MCYADWVLNANHLISQKNYPTRSFDEISIEISDYYYAYKFYPNGELNISIYFLPFSFHQSHVKTIETFKVKTKHLSYLLFRSVIYM